MKDGGTDDMRGGNTEGGGEKGEDTEKRKKEEEAQVASLLPAYARAMRCPMLT